MEQYFPLTELSTAFIELSDRLAASRASGALKRRESAAGFCVFDFIAPSENVLSDILAFLLKPDETHGQETLFLEKLLARVCPGKVAEMGGVAVAREALTYTIENHRRRIDVLVTFQNFVFAIETKKFTGEGWNQIADYCDHLERVSQNRFCIVFLTRTGEEAGSIDQKESRRLVREGKLVLCSWETDVPAWLKECGASCGAPKIRHFLEDFRTYIKHYLATKSSEDTNDEE
jgi:hypothetical protein